MNAFIALQFYVFSGLVVVAVFFLGLKDNLDLKTIGKYADGVVGALMVILGLYGVFAALRTYNEKYAKRSEDKAILESDYSSNESGNFVEISHTAGDRSCKHEQLRQCDLKDPRVQKLVAFIIGTVHGIGGPGGVLGVLPAVELNDWSAASLYLISFVLSSTVCMGGFAAFYGEATKRLGATADVVEFALNLFSCGLSVVVGAVWVGFSIYGGREILFN